MVTTRSASSSPVKKLATSTTSKPLARQEQQLKHFILPRNADSSWRFITLPHPRTDIPARFLSEPDKSLHIFTQVSAPSTDLRSILVTPEAAAIAEGSNDQGHISKDAQLLVATLFDCVFLLLPFLLPARSQSGKRLFQSLDDILESSVEKDRSWRHFVRNNEQLLANAAAFVCDTVEAGDEKMYRVNEEKAYQSLLKRAQKAVSVGLPKTVEDKFVTRVLEAPMLSLKRETTSETTIVETSTIEDDLREAADSQSSVASTVVSSVFSVASSSSTVVSSVDETVPLNVTQLQRLRTAFTFITASYLPSHLVELFYRRLNADREAADFKPLDEHLNHLANLKAEALATRSLSDFSRKRSNLEDEDLAEERAEKKRKLEEEEKRKKAGISRGVRDLQKVNVTGMKKMSDFFTKKPAAKVKG